MARKFYQLRAGAGAKEHPESFAERGYPELAPGQVYPGGYRRAKDHQLLHPGDIFEVEDTLILRRPAAGGWMDIEANGERGEGGLVRDPHDGSSRDHPDFRVYLSCAVEVPNATNERFAGWEGTPNVARRQARA